MTRMGNEDWRSGGSKLAACCRRTTPPIQACVFEVGGGARVPFFLTADYTDDTDGRLGLEIGGIGFIQILSSHNTLPL